MDPRFEKISELLINYSQGSFDSKIEVTDQLDEIDAFISSINMLGEELKVTTISRNRFNNIFNSVSDMLFVLDEDGVINEVNKSVIDVLGFNIEQSNLHIDDLIFQKSEKSFFKSAKNTLLKNINIFEAECTIKFSLKNIPIHCASSNLYNEGHQKIGYLIRAKDLTDIRQYETALQESEIKYRKIFEESSDCIFIINKEGNIIDLNFAGQALFEKPKNQLFKYNLFDFFSVKSEKKKLSICF